MFLPTDQIDLDQLPESLSALAEMIGLSLSLALVKHYGGITLEVPKKIGDNHYLTKALGKKDALRFCEFYGGDRLYVPKVANALRRMRNRKIIQDYTEGLTIKELVRKYRLCDRQVWNVLKEPLPIPEKMKQISLFEHWK